MRAITAAGRVLVLVLLANLGLSRAWARQEEPDAPATPGAWEALDAAARGFAWTAFEAAYGEGWRVLWNETTGSPNWPRDGLAVRRSRPVITCRRSTP